MKCRGKFKFIEIIKKDGGSFTNSSGNVINYPASYRLKLNDKTENGIEQRVFKIADKPENVELINQLEKFEEYSDIILDFDVVFSSNSISIIPTAILTK